MSETIVPTGPLTDGQALTPDRVAAAIDTMRARQPRVHALVSTVAQPLVANIASALGVDISMTVSPAEMRVMVTHSDAVLINLGMLDDLRREASLAAAATGTPFVLDPVKVDRVPARLAFARELLAAGPRIVKCNAAEKAALADALGGTVAVTTGAHDRIAAAGRSAVLGNGSPMLPRVTATGCATGLLMAALMAVEPDPFVAAGAGAALMGVAGEVAAMSARGPGSFAVELIDALAALNGGAVSERLVFLDD